MEYMKKLSYWKKEVVDKKVEELKKRLFEEEEIKNEKKIYTNRKSEVILSGKRANKPVEDILQDWIIQKNQKQQRLEQVLKCPFKPKLNPKSMRMMKDRPKDTLSYPIPPL